LAGKHGAAERMRNDRDLRETTRKSKFSVFGVVGGCFVLKLLEQQE